MYRRSKLTFPKHHPFRAAAGIKLDVLVRSDNESSFTVDQQLALTAGVATDVSSIEGLNEADNEGASYGSLTGTPAVLAVSAEIASFVASTASLAGVGIIAPSTGSYSPSFIASLGDLDGEVTQNNAHIYPTGNSPPFWAIAPSLTALSGIAPGLPTTVTEFGYNALVGRGGVDETVQAKDILNGLLDMFRLGVTQTFLYELLDNPAALTNTDTVEDCYGLFNADGTSRLVATALHNLTTVLADPGASSSFQPQTLCYTLSGLPWNGWQTLFGKSDGSSVLALWSEPQIWDGQEEVAAPGQTVTVNFAAPEAEVLVFDPLVGTAPIASYSGVAAVSVDLVDHLLLVEVLPAVVEEAVACYCAGTLILTGTGPVKVKDLAVGDSLVTLSGALETIRWVGRRRYAGRLLAGRKDLLPIRFKAGALDDGAPAPDLLVSTMHAMLIDGMLVPAHALVNGVTITQEGLLQAVDYIHVELAHRDAIWPREPRARPMSRTAAGRCSTPQWSSRSCRTGACRRISHRGRRAASKSRRSATGSAPASRWQLSTAIILQGCAFPATSPRHCPDESGRGGPASARPAAAVFA